MKQLIQIFQALLGASALICTAFIAVGRLSWHKIRGKWNKCSKWLRHLMTSIMITIPIGFFVLIGNAYYDSKHGRHYWKNKSLSQNLEIHSFKDNKYRIYNRNIDKYTTPKVNWISNSPGNDSLTVYAIPQKRGYISTITGNIIINAETNIYRKAWGFSEGMGAVMKDGKIGFINAKNEIVIPFQYDYSNKDHMRDFGYLFHNGYCIMTNKDGDLGLIDTKGKWVIEPVYDEIWNTDENNYKIIVKEEKHGVIDSLCNIVYPTEYDCIDVLSDGFVLTQKGKKWQVDFEGNIIQSFMFDGTYYLNYPIGYNERGDIQYAFANYVKYEIMNLCGIMDRITGEPITLALYSDINMLSKELFEVQDPMTLNWSLLNINRLQTKKKN